MDVHEHDRAHHGREGERRADRQVDAAGDDHEQLAERKDRDHGCLEKTLPMFRLVRKIGVVGYHDHEHEQDQRRAEAQGEQREPSAR